MKTNTKMILVAISVVAIVVGTLISTLAYLTASKAVTNTFTVGKVAIELDETDVDDSKTGVTTAGRDKRNEYHLLPGQTYVKDPTVTVLANSSESYVRMIVTVEGMDSLKAAIPADKYPTYYNGDIFLLQNLVAGWDKEVWAFAGYEDGQYEFRYVGTVAGTAEDTMLAPLFTEIIVPGFVDNDGIDNMAKIKIHVEAHAIQAIGFDDVDAAWSAFTK